jgi:uncharacterized protein
MILVDTGPLVALFDPKDGSHGRARATLASIREPIVTTIPVLTESFHLLDPSSRGASALREFLEAGGVVPWFFSKSSLRRAWEVMKRYADKPMDLADASLVVASEELRTTTVFTLDRRDFSAYRARIGKTLKGFRLM